MTVNIHYDYRLSNLNLISKKFKYYKKSRLSIFLNLKISLSYFILMDPILKIIKYYLSQNNILNNDDSIDSFFDNGVSFPQFISTIYNESIPKIIKVPKTLSNKNSNNELALQFIFQKNDYFQKINLKYDSYEDKVNLLELIITQLCFTTDYKEIIKKCNSILQPLGIKYAGKKDLLKFSNLLTLLNAFTNEDLKIISDDQINIIDILKESFKKANVPFVLDENSLSIQKQYQFYIQIDIIFNNYKNKDQKLDICNNIDNLQTNNKNDNNNIYNNDIDDDGNNNKNTELKYQKNLDDNEESEGETSESFDETNDKKEENSFKFETESFDFGENQDNLDENENSDKGEKMIKFSNKKKSRHGFQTQIESKKMSEIIHEIAILKTINSIGSKGGFHFKNFFDAVKNDSLPNFVMFFLNIQSIENVKLSNSSSISKNQIYENLTDQQIKNIDAVIKFLEQKCKKFEILLFDFTSKENIRISSLLFYKTFLDFFFIKQNKKDMYQRCLRIKNTIDIKDADDESEDFKELKNWELYISLIQFLITGNLHIVFNSKNTEINQNVAESFFETAKIPFIINDNMIENINTKSSLFFYQLQFIFDAIDLSRKSHHVVEALLDIIYVLKRMKPPNIKNLVSSINAKRESFKLQSERKDNYLKRNSFSYKEEKSEIQKKITKEISKISRYKERVDLSTTQQFENIEKTNDEAELQTNKNPKRENLNVDEIRNKFDSFNAFLNKPNPNIGYDNGILFNKLQSQEQKTKAHTEWINEMEILKKNTSQRISQSFHSQNKNENRSFSFIKTASSNLEAKLYKLFYYDVSNNQWCFNYEDFELFSKDKNININNSRTPLVLFLNSDVNDIIDICSNLIKNLYPNLSLEEDIFVYALCDKSLAMLNYVIDFTDTLKASIKPIFLLLHIPKKKENLSNIQTIIVQIYSFLSSVCNLQVVVLNKKHYLDQINLLKTISKINENLSKSLNNKDKSNSDHSSSSDSSEDDDDIENNDFEEDEWENINEIDSFHKIIFQNQRKIENINEFNYKLSKIILLVKDETIKLDEKIEMNLSKSTFFKTILVQIHRLGKINFIDPKNTNSYKSFLTSMNDFIIGDFSSYEEIKNNFIYIKYFMINSLYIHLKSLDQESFITELKKIISERYEMIKSSSTAKSLVNIMGELQEEFSLVPPSYDDNFLSQCYSVINEMIREENMANKDKIQNELKISADSHLNYLKDSMNQKYYWTKEQMGLMKIAHQKFLEEEFYSIIKIISFGKELDMIYANNIEILDKQKINDNSIIDKIFKPFVEIIEIKNKSKEKDFKESIESGTNYVMKETEHLREIKVTVHLNKDLTSEIKQDF